MGESEREIGEERRKRGKGGEGHKGDDDEDGDDEEDDDEDDEEGEEEKGERTGWCMHPVHRRAMCTWLASPNSQTLKSRAIDAKP